MLAPYRLRIGSASASLLLRIGFASGWLLLRVNPSPAQPPATYGEGMDEQKRTEDQLLEEDAPLGGDEATANELVADNPAEEEVLKTLDPNAPAA